MLFAPTTKRLPNALYEPLYHRSGGVLQLMHCKQQHANAVEAHKLHAKREAFANIVKLDLDSKGPSSIDGVANSSNSNSNSSSTTSTSSSVPCEIVEIMMKLDAKIVSYLAGDNVSSSDEQLALKCLKTTSSPLEQLVGKIAKDRGDTFNEANIIETTSSPSSTTPSLSLPLSEQPNINGLTLHIEALTLQPEGTKRMELLQNEMRPIFTVECQLSNDLIDHVPRYDMFNVLQFESEKFHSLTQCTRFGQESYRDIRLPAESASASESGSASCGQISFTVWWREPGTCLNEMLGVGRLNLRDMCDASLLEQCKCISISKRQIHLASLYMKISLKSQVLAVVPPHMQPIDGDNNNDCNKNAKGAEATTAGPAQSNTTNAMHNEGIAAAAAAATAANSDDHVQNNNNLLVQSGDFSNETSKVRLLKGFICASELRNLDLNSSSSGSSRDYELVLVCRRFWQEEVTAITTQEDGKNFNYQEQFAVLNDEKFLKRADKQYLILEFWQRLKDTSPLKCNEESAIVPLGIARLPMHQFFIAYRDAAITNHLCNGKLPVISFDAWAPITRTTTTSSSSSTGQQSTAGEIKCLLAIGSEEQISHLKSTKGFPLNTPPPMNTLNSKGLRDLLNSRKLLASQNVDNRGPPTAVQSTADLMEMLQRKLATQTPAAPSAAGTADNKLFHFILNVRQAKGLPLNPSTSSAKGSKKAAKRNTNAMRRYPPNEAPSSYVTFQATSCEGPSYKSHEGDVYATHIVDKSTQPQWCKWFPVTANREYLSNVRKRFIVKIWKKSNTPALAAAAAAAPTTIMATPLHPTPLDDAIIGFAAIDLTPLARGYNVTDWYNVVDFNGRINGQLEVECCALFDAVDNAASSPLASPANVPLSSGTMMMTTSASSSSSIDSSLEQFERSLQLSHLNLGQAIKRKFGELEEISQRLRSRLGDVTGEALADSPDQAFDMSSLDNWKSLESVLDGEEFLLHDDFERDIATPTEIGPNVSEANGETKKL